MTARYLLRFDDICPTMDWMTWGKIEALLLKHDIKPLLAVVPDNKDPALVVAPPRPDFWDYIRACQSRGWAIAMHGLHHLYETDQQGLLRINRYSEFSGLPYEKQRGKIEQAVRIFAAQNVRVDAWIAPGHNFDATTLKVLREFGITTISDGFYWRVVEYLGAVWVPQQMWRFRHMPFGTWTVCMHANHLPEGDISGLADDLARFAKRILSLHDVVPRARPCRATWFDHGFSRSWRAMLLRKLSRTAPASIGEPPTCTGTRRSDSHAS